MKQSIVLASGNRHKLEELTELLGSGPWALELLSDKASDIQMPPETAPDFRGNAAIKAEFVSQEFDCWAIADDSGLVVDVLDGRPGVRSARYAGSHASDAGNREKLLGALLNVSPALRTARFVCVLALARPGFPTIFVEGRCEGMILGEERGNEGFGYDSLFYVPELGRSFAEIPSALKHQWSHRGAAAEQLKVTLERLLS